MVNDENTGSAWVDEDGRDRYTIDFNDREQARIDASLEFAKEVLRRGRRQAHLPDRRAQHPRPGQLPDGLRP